MIKTVHASIEGKVQGVWYRNWTVQEAQNRGLSGWVRNRKNGSVEAVFSGPASAVDSMIRACFSGPPAAEVLQVSTCKTVPPGQTGFVQLPTA